LSDFSKKIVLLVGAVFVTLVAGEMILRVIGYGAITPELNFGVNTRMALDQGRFLPDKDLFWKLPPHPLDGEIRAIQPDTPVPPKGAARRILILGDSCSKISQKLPPYSALLEDTLRGHNVEVWNASVPGYSVWQGRAWLHKQLLAIEPDVTVVYFGWNDHWRSTGTTDAEYAASRQTSSLRLLALFHRQGADRPLRVPVTEYGEILGGIVSDLCARGTVVYLIAAPSNLTGEARQRLVQSGYLRPGDNALELHRRYLLELKEVADTTDATMLNISGLFAGLNAPRLLLMRDGIHLTDRGHQVLAAVLAEACGPVLDAGTPVPVASGDLADRAHAAFGAIPSPEAR